LSVDQNTLYICDKENHRIQGLNRKNYSFHHEWGSRGLENGQFCYPNFVCYWEDLVYVSDQYSVQLFTCEGMFLQRLGDKEFGTKPTQFRGAEGLCVVGDRLYVSDYWNSRIQVFRRLRGSEIENEKLKLKNQKNQNNGCIIH